MAELTGNVASGGGLLSPLARAQYGAMARLRWQMFRISIRSKQGALELGAAAVTWAIYGLLSLLLGAAAGAATYFAITDGGWRMLPVLFWVLAFVWQMIPIMLASFQQQFDLGILLRFPVRFGSYYLLYLVFGLLDISTALGVVACVGIWAGVAIAQPALLGWTTLALVMFAAFNILLVRAIFAWIERWLAQRKTREILGAVFMVGLLSLQIFNPALYRNGQHSGHHGAGGPMAQAEQLQAAKHRYAPLLRQVDLVQQWLPPGLAARSLQQAVARRPLSGLDSLGLLGLYSLLAGSVLGLRLGAVYRGENLGMAPARTGLARTGTTPGRAKAAASAASAVAFSPAASGSAALGTMASGPISAIMEKDIRSLLRTLPLLYAIGAPLLLVLVFSSVFIHNGASVPTVSFPFALPTCLVYAQLGFTQIFYNSLGTEGAGVQFYFLSPTPMRTVLLAKNILHALLFAVVVMLGATLAMLRLGVPDSMMIAATAAWVCFSLPCNLAAGNLFSIKMPYRVNPGRISRQRGSQGNALLSLLVQIGFLAISAAVFAIAWFVGRIWLAVPIFMVLTVGAAVVWHQVLGTANDLANERKTALITALMKEG